MPKSPVKKAPGTEAPGPPRAIAVETPADLPGAKSGGKGGGKSGKTVKTVFRCCASAGCLSGTAALFSRMAFFSGRKEQADGLSDMSLGQGLTGKKQMSGGQ